MGAFPAERSIEPAAGRIDQLSDIASVGPTIQRYIDDDIAPARK